jgi:hypothetical protein
VAQVVELLLIKHKDLNTNLVPPKKKVQNNQKKSAGVVAQAPV